MRAAWLIAGNFAREQRWSLLLLYIYLIGISLAFGFAEDRVNVSEVVLYFRQQAFYALILPVFLVSGALHNDRKTRRILAVLSKGIERHQYLAGLLMGTAMATSLFCAMFALGLGWLQGRAGVRSEDVGEAAFALAVAGTLVGAIALFYSTFLNPLFTTAATGFTVAAPYLLGHYLRVKLDYVIAVHNIAMDLARFNVLSPWSPDWLGVTVAAVEILFFWIAASVIFRYRDVTSALE